MKKHLAMLVGIVAIATSLAVRVASAGPIADTPLDHWVYEAPGELSEVGTVEEITQKAIVAAEATAIPVGNTAVVMATMTMTPGANTAPPTIALRASPTTSNHHYMANATDAKMATTQAVARSAPRVLVGLVTLSSRT